MAISMLVFAVSAHAYEDTNEISIKHKKNYTVNFIDSTELNQSITLTGIPDVLSVDPSSSDPMSELISYFRTQTEN